MFMVYTRHCFSFLSRYMYFKKLKQKTLERTCESSHFLLFCRITWRPWHSHNCGCRAMPRRAMRTPPRQEHNTEGNLHSMQVYVLYKHVHVQYAKLLFLVQNMICTLRKVLFVHLTKKNKKKIPQNLVKLVRTHLNDFQFFKK